MKGGGIFSEGNEKSKRPSEWKNHTGTKGEAYPPFLKWTGVINLTGGGIGTPKEFSGSRGTQKRRGGGGVKSIGRNEDSKG